MNTFTLDTLTNQMVKKLWNLYKTFTCLAYKNMVTTSCIIFLFSLVFLYVHTKVLDKPFIMYVVLIYLLEIGLGYCYQILGFIQLLDYYLHILEVDFWPTPWHFCVPILNALCKHFQTLFLGLLIDAYFGSGLLVNSSPSPCPYL